MVPGQPTKCVSFCLIFCTSKPLLPNPGNGSGLHLTLHLCGQVSATPPDYFGCLFGVAQVWQYHPKLCYFYFSLLQQVLQVSGQSPKIQNLLPTAVPVAITEKSPHPGLPASREHKLVEPVTAEIFYQNEQNTRILWLSTSNNLQTLWKLVSLEATGYLISLSALKTSF